MAKLPTHGATKLPTHGATKLPTRGATKLPTHGATKLPTGPWRCQEATLPRGHSVKRPLSTGWVAVLIEQRVGRLAAEARGQQLFGIGERSAADGQREDIDLHRKRVGV